jgi:hypothetical protein
MDDVGLRNSEYEVSSFAGSGGGEDNASFLRFETEQDAIQFSSITPSKHFALWKLFLPFSTPGFIRAKQYYRNFQRFLKSQSDSFSWNIIDSHISEDLQLHLLLPALDWRVNEDGLGNHLPDLL